LYINHIPFWWTNLAHLVRLQLFSFSEPQNPTVVQGVGTIFATYFALLHPLIPQ